jgi:hypothetical protein
MEWDTDMGEEEPGAHTTRAPDPTKSTENTPKSTAGSCPVVEAEQLELYTASVARLKQLTALVHGNRLSNDMRAKLSFILDEAFNQAADEEKQHVNQTDNFTQLTTDKPTTILVSERRRERGPTMKATRTISMKRTSKRTPARVAQRRRNKTSATEWMDR